MPHLHPTPLTRTVTVFVGTVRYDVAATFVFRADAPCAWVVTAIGDELHSDVVDGDEMAAFRRLAQAVFDHLSEAFVWHGFAPYAHDPGFSPREGN